MNILLKNARIVTSEEIYEGYVAVDGGKIKEVGKGKAKLVPKCDTEYDIGGKFLLPGVIDCHVHFRAPGQEYKEDWNTGSAAAVAGGVTTVLDMPNNNPPIVSVKALEKKRKLVAGTSRVNFGFFIGATSDNAEEIKKAKGFA